MKNKVLELRKQINSDEEYDPFTSDSIILNFMLDRLVDEAQSHDNIMNKLIELQLMGKISEKS